MNVKQIRSYRNPNGNMVFVYSVSCNEKQLAEYKSAQGEYYRETEDKTPLWFTSRSIGNTGKLIITSKNKVIADMSEFDQAASLASQYGGNLGQELAKHAAAKLMGGQSLQDTTPEPVPEQA